MADGGLIVAFSGGKDSTALALRLAELGRTFRLLHTATGNELPGVRQHVELVAAATGARLIDLAAPTLSELIEEQGCLPSWRMRWCTRMIKIEPAAAHLRNNPGSVLAVGLRADEPSRAGGTYDCETTFPLRDWGWDECAVRDYCARRKFTPPTRTDCAVCFFQTLSEWHALWREHPEMYRQGETWETQTGHTFRSPSRDTQPAALVDLRAKFERGYIPTVRKRKTMCRVCAA